MIETIQNLKQLGLDEKSAKLYLAALELGPSPIAKLAKKSGIKRTTIYYFIDDLIAKNLLTSNISGKRKLFAATSPDNLSLIVEKQKELVQKMVPEMFALFNKSPQKPKVSFYEGIDGLKTVFMDALDQPPKSDILYFTHYGQVYNALTEKFVNDFVTKRLKNDISTKAIATGEGNAVRITKFNKKEKRRIITLPEEIFSTSIDMRMYQNKVAIMSFGDEKVGMIIESKQIADTLKSVFNLLWEKLQ